MSFASVDGQLKVLTRGVERIDTLDELRAKLGEKRPLRIKLGLDPTAPDIHLGHTVVLRKMRQFQDLGHKAILIIGDYTAKVGDPSGRSKVRPVLDAETIEANAQTYFDQAGKVLDTSKDKLEVRQNSEWLEGMTFADVLKLSGQATVGQMLKRDDFRKRFEAEVPIGVHEFMYPLMQGWDSVCIESDVELGGTDQTFNNLVGRDLQRNAGQKAQVVMVMPILVGLDGQEKMSKSLGNYVGVAESAHDMFGKLMSVPDECMANYFTVLTDLPAGRIQELTGSGQTHPMDAKKMLAETITKGFHDNKAAARTRCEWEQIHQKSAQASTPFGIQQAAAAFVVPGGTPSVVVSTKIVRVEGEGADKRNVFLFDPVSLTRQCGFASTNSEARRLLEQSGIRLNGKILPNSNKGVEVKTGDVLQRGKRKFVRLQVER